MFNYPATLKKDTDGSTLVSFADVPEAITCGDTKDEALMHAVDALETALSLYVDAGKALPVPSSKRRGVKVSPSLQGRLKLAVYQAMKDQKIRKTDLARSMGVALMQIDRILDLTHASRIEQIEAALMALGNRVEMKLKSAQSNSFEKEEPLDASSDIADLGVTVNWPKIIQDMIAYPTVSSDIKETALDKDPMIVVQEFKAVLEKVKDSLADCPISDEQKYALMNIGKPITLKKPKERPRAQKK